MGLNKVVVLGWSAVFLMALAHCGHAPSRQRIWWDDYGRSHGCRVIATHSVERVRRHGQVYEHEEACYVCPRSPTEYCFGGPPVGPPVGSSDRVGVSYP